VTDCNYTTVYSSEAPTGVRPGPLGGYRDLAFHTGSVAAPHQPRMFLANHKVPVTRTAYPSAGSPGHWDIVDAITLMNQGFDRYVQHTCALLS
jgi:hypothetical protein